LSDPQIDSQEKLKRNVEKLILTKREVVAISSATKTRPSLFNHSFRVEKGLLDKIKQYFMWFLQIFLPNSYSDTVLNWQSQVSSFSSNSHQEIIKNSLSFLQSQ